MEVGKFIREKREDLGLSQEDIARACGVNRATVSRWESGNISNMRRNKLEALANVLQISPSALLTETIDDSIDFRVERFTIQKEPSGVDLNPLITELICRAMSATDDEIRAAIAVMDALKARRG